MMKPRIDVRIKKGRWDDEWVSHPFATLKRARRKAMSWLTPNLSINEDRIIDMFLRAGSSRIDNVFLKTWRLFNAFGPAGRRGLSGTADPLQFQPHIVSTNKFARCR